MGRPSSKTSYGTAQRDGTVRALHSSRIGHRKRGKGKQLITRALFDDLVDGVGGSENSGKVADHGPAGVSCAGFFCASSRFDCMSENQTIKKPNKTSNHRANKPAGAGNILLFRAGVGSSSVQLLLPLQAASACVVCGAPFEVVRRRGRPLRFCSDPCRAEQLRRQKSRWSRENYALKRAVSTLKETLDGNS